MKIIHTADWHIGAELYGHDRAADHHSFFDHLATLLDSEQPDALVVSGDIYDRVLPTHTAQKLYIDTILRLHEASPDTEIVMVAGNHDSASRLEITRPLWTHFNVHVIGFIERSGEDVNRDKHIITIPNKGYIIALPFVYPHAYPPTSDETEDRQRAYITSLIELVEERNDQGLPIVLMAHTAVAGSDFVGHKEHEILQETETRSTVGNIEVITFDELGSGYDYLALGHIHRPQEIKGSGGTAYYSGAPFAIGFDEVFPHSVNLVEVERGARPIVKRVPIHPKRRLVTIPTHPAPLDSVIKAIETELDPEEELFVRINLGVEGMVPVGAEARIMEALKSKPHAIFCTIKYTNTLEAKVHHEHDQVEMYQSVRENDPIEIAHAYMSGKVNDEMLEEYKNMIDGLWQEIIRAK